MGAVIVLIGRFASFGVRGWLPVETNDRGEEVSGTPSPLIVGRVGQLALQPDFSNCAALM